MAWCVIACGNGYGANALSAGVGAVSIGGCGIVVVSVQILPACNHGQIWAEVRVQAGRWWWWSWVVVGNWGWMVGGSRWFVVDSVWVISFIEVFIRRAQKSLEIRAKYVACDRPFKMLGAGPLLGQALQNAWDRPF